MIQVDASVLEEHAASIFMLDMIRMMMMWSGYIGRVTRNVVTRNSAVTG
jgi:hypothetical protein